MLIGRRERFAIEAEQETASNGWVFARFRFWLCGQAVGNWDDVVDMKGCLHWLRDFAENPRDRYDPQLEGANPQRVFSLVCDPVIGTGGIPHPEAQPIPHAFSRFHIAHLGMSSFELFDVLLVKDQHGGERCLWRKAGDEAINECRLWRNEMEAVALEFCDSLEKEMPPEQC